MSGPLSQNRLASSAVQVRVTPACPADVAAVRVGPTESW